MSVPARVLDSQICSVSTNGAKAALTGYTNGRTTIALLSFYSSFGVYFSGGVIFLKVSPRGQREILTIFIFRPIHFYVRSTIVLGTWFSVLRRTTILTLN